MLIKHDSEVHAIKKHCTESQYYTKVTNYCTHILYRPTHYTTVHTVQKYSIDILPVAESPQELCQCVRVIRSSYVCVNKKDNCWQTELNLLDCVFGIGIWNLIFGIWFVKNYFGIWFCCDKWNYKRKKPRLFPSRGWVVVKTGTITILYWHNKIGCDIHLFVVRASTHTMPFDLIQFITHVVKPILNSLRVV